MRYFPPELLFPADSSEDPQASRRASRRFEWNLRRYHKQLETLKSRVSPSAWHFMAAVNRHDSTMLSIATGDFVFGVTRTGRSQLVNRRRANAVVRLADQSGVVHEITYSGIKAFSLDYNKIPEWRWSLRKCFDDWLIDEWTAAGKNHLCHEVLFSSGAWFRIVFQQVKVRRRKANCGAR